MYRSGREMCLKKPWAENLISPLYIHLIHSMQKSMYNKSCQNKTKNKLRGLSTSELYWPSDRRLLAKLVPTFVDRRVPRGQHDGSLRPYSRISRLEPLLFLSSSSSIVLTSWVDPIPGSLLLGKSGSAGNRDRASGSVARNSDHWTTEAV
jgi:hypothetical protein